MQVILDKATFHISGISPYTLGWLDAFGIPKERVVDGTVSAKALIVPMNRCGNAYYSQINWMRGRLLPLVTDDKGQLTNTVIKSDKKLTVAVIERYNGRPVSNMAEASAEVAKFAEKHNMNIVYHTDKKGVPFPPVIDQVKMFANADIVIAPHGAGLMHATFVPPHACVIEFADPPSSPYCFSHICYVRNVSYIMVTMVEWIMKLPDINDSMTKCLKVVKNNLGQQE